MTQAQRTLNNRYELVAKLGDGGMAVVFKALDRKLNRTVAIKVLRESYASDAQFLARFNREAQSAASLTHPNIISVYDVGQDGDINYIVMEYVEGQNLKELITEQAPLPMTTAIQYAIQVCNAIGFAHSKGLIHRDIKPQNIMIDRSGQAKVADFGIAKGLGDATLTQTGFTIGTVHYFSPEQAQGKPAVVQSDLYSIGVVLYEMLTGHIPFESDNPVALALKHVEDAPPSPRRYNPNIPPALEAIVLKAMAKTPAQRFPTAAAFAQALKDFEGAADMGTMAVPKSPISNRITPPAPVKPVVETDFYQPSSRPSARPDAYKPEELDDYNNYGNGRRRQPTNPGYNDPYYNNQQPRQQPQAYYNAGRPSQQQDFYVQQSRANIPPVVDEYEDEQTGRRGSGCMPWIIGTLLLGMLIGLVVLLVVFLVPALTKPQPTPVPALPTATLGPAAKVDMPDVKNKTLAEAEDTLKQAGLALGTTTTQFNDKVEGGRVISQSVDPKAKVDKGAKINLVISQGVDAVKLPQKFVNTPYDDTRKAIENLGFKTQRVDQPSDTIGTGAVIKTDPEGGPDSQPIPRSVVIKIFVSTGPLPTATPVPTPTSTPTPPPSPTPSPTPVMVTVPANVIGMKEADATKALQNAGFKVTVMRWTLADIQQKFPNDPVAVQTWQGMKDGDALGTDPKGGTQIPKGSEVVLAVKSTK